ncbi:vacuolar protein sorting-associated protein [Thecamonas trahens ATCC 50062]|uniref:Vacuolar protein sorting-associated protein n=1 Tax=Thecamonas trahens ATCC 50062 TaxID=461836 RepID=A0A0L0D5R0_THETB|nr:vacuolar protein sorting-associated protein [Thecamonas trahens ATCC 50062]KNC47426.1 vacuolar protein sorting-associated protein [Thecamonas trahens ATCC 50062]|eukprot:XP_013759762.1 vacuolar protein sorting-associated protein [Thecamonas trahens ATCC 50062]
MLGSLASSLFTRALGEYFESHSLASVGLRDSSVHFTDVVLAPAVIDSLGLPLALFHGTAKSLTFTAPLKKLNSSPASLVMSDIAIVLVPPGWDLARAHAAKIRALESLEARKAAIASRPDSPSSDSPAAAASPTAAASSSAPETESKSSRLLASVVSNMSLELNNVHVRIELDSASAAAAPVALGFTCERLTVDTTDADFQTAFVKAVLPFVYRSAALAGFSIYAGVVAPASLVSRHPVPHFAKHMAAAAEAAPRDVLLLPTSASARLQQPRSPTDLLTLALDLDALSASVSPHALAALSRLRDALLAPRAPAPHLAHRPRVPVLADPLAWFRYAATAVLAQVHDRASRRTPRYLAARRKARLAYMNLWQEILTSKDGKLKRKADAAALDTLEHELSFDDIRLFRIMAEISLAKSNALALRFPNAPAALRLAGKRSRKTSVASRMMRVFRKPPPAPAVAPPPASGKATISQQPKSLGSLDDWLTEDQWAELYAALACDAASDLTESSPASTPRTSATATPDDAALSTRLSLSVGLLRVAVIDAAGSRLATLASGALSTSYTSTLGGSFHVDAALSRLKAFDHTQTDGKRKLVLGPRFASRGAAADTPDFALTYAGHASDSGTASGDVATSIAIRAAPLLAHASLPLAHAVTHAFAHPADTRAADSWEHLYARYGDSWHLFAREITAQLNQALAPASSPRDLSLDVGDSRLVFDLPGSGEALVLDFGSVTCTAPPPDAHILLPALTLPFTLHWARAKPDPSLPSLFLAGHFTSPITLHISDASLGQLIRLGTAWADVGSAAPPPPPTAPPSPAALAQASSEAELLPTAVRSLSSDTLALLVPSTLLAARVTFASLAVELHSAREDAPPLLVLTANGIDLQRTGRMFDTRTSASLTSGVALHFADRRKPVIHISSLAYSALAVSPLSPLHASPRSGPLFTKSVHVGDIALDLLPPAVDAVLLWLSHVVAGSGPPGSSGPPLAQGSLSATASSSLAQVHGRYSLALYGAAITVVTAAADDRPLATASVPAWRITSMTTRDLSELLVELDDLALTDATTPHARYATILAAPEQDSKLVSISVHESTTAAVVDVAIAPLELIVLGSSLAMLGKVAEYAATAGAELALCADGFGRGRLDRLTPSALEEWSARLQALDLSYALSTGAARIVVPAAAAGPHVFIASATRIKARSGAVGAPGFQLTVADASISTGRHGALSGLADRLIVLPVDIVVLQQEKLKLWELAWAHSVTAQLGPDDIELLTTLLTAESGNMRDIGPLLDLASPTAHPPAPALEATPSYRDGPVSLAFELALRLPGASLHLADAAGIELFRVKAGELSLDLSRYSDGLVSANAALAAASLGDTTTPSHRLHPAHAQAAGVCAVRVQLTTGGPDLALSVVLSLDGLTVYPLHPVWEQVATLVPTSTSSSPADCPGSPSRASLLEAIEARAARMSISATLCDLQLLFLGQPASHVSDTVAVLLDVLDTSYAHNARRAQTSAFASFKHCQVVRCVAAAAKRSTILAPATLELHLASAGTEPLDLDVDISALSIDISARDLVLVRAILEQLPPSDDVGAIAVEETPALTGPARLQAQLRRSLHLLSRLARGRAGSEQLSVTAKAIQVLVVDDRGECLATPVGRSGLSAVELQLAGWSDDATANGVVTFELSADVYNTETVAWEPLVEPWTAFAKLVTGCVVEAGSTRCLNINATPRAVGVLLSGVALIEARSAGGRKVGWAAAAAAAAAADVDSPSLNAMPYRLVNETGEPLTLSYAIDAEESLPVETTSVRRGDVVGFALETPGRAARRDGDAHHDVHIQIRGYQPGIHVDVDAVGAAAYAVVCTETGAARQVVVAVAMAHRCKVLRIGSGLAVANNCTEPLAIREAGTEGDGWQLPAGDRIPIPLAAAQSAFEVALPHCAWSTSVIDARSASSPRTVVCHKASGKGHAVLTATAKTEHLDSLGAYLLVLRPPLTLINALPVPMNIRVSKGKRVVFESGMRCGESLPIHIDYAGPESVNLSVCPKLFGWSAATPLTTSRIVVRDLAGAELRLGLHCEGEQAFTLYAPYWMVNATREPLVFRQAETVLARDAKSAGQHAPRSAMSAPSPVMFSLVHMAMGRTAQVGMAVSARRREMAWSKPFGIDSVGTTGSVTVVAGALALELGLDIKLGPGVFQLTKVVTVSYRVVVRNTLEVPIRLRLSTDQTSKSGKDARMKLEPGEARHVVWPIGSASSRRMAMRPRGTGHGWSTEFAVDSIGEFALKCTGDGVSMFLSWIHVALSAATLIVTMAPAAGAPPFVVSNETPFAVSLRQLPDGVPEVFEPWCMAAPYAWDAPQGALLAELAVDDPTATGAVRLALAEIGSHHSHLVLEPSGAVVKVKVATSGRTLLVELSPADDGDEESEGDDVGEDGAEAKVGADRAVFISLARLALSLVCRQGVDSTGSVREVALLTAEGVFAEVSVDGSDRTLYELALREVQIDNQLLDAQYPVMLAFDRAPNDDGGRGAWKTKPAVHVTAVERSSPDEAVVVFEHLEVLVQAMRLELDEAALFAILDYMFQCAEALPDAASGAMQERDDGAGASHTEALCALEGLSTSEFVDAAGHSSVVGALAREIVPRSQVARKGCGRQSHDVLAGTMVYFKVLFLSPISVMLTYTGSGSGAGAQYGQSSQISRALVSLGVTMVEVEQVAIALNALVLEHVFTSQDLAGCVGQHYSSQLYYQLYKVVGSFAVLGDPATLLGGLGSGVRDFFFEPARGLIRSPAEFARGLGAGSASLVKNVVYGVFNTTSKVTGAVGSGLGMLSLDDEWRRNRERSQRARPAHVVAGLTSGVRDMSRGVASGIAGLVVHPVQGARSGGALGLLRGLGKGVVGAAVKPVTGVLDLAAQTSRGIKNTTRLLERSVTRKRRPRLVGIDNVVHRYNVEGARVQLLLHQLAPGDRYAFHVLIRIASTSSAGDGETVADDAYYWLLASEHWVFLLHLRRNRRRKLQSKVVWRMAVAKLGSVDVDDDGVSLVARSGKVQRVALPDEAQRASVVSRLVRLVPVRGLA